MPDPGLPYRLRHRVSGLGSLGRPRYVALAEWCGGRIAREAKALAAVPKQRDERRLLYAMGWETANVHLGSRTAIRAVRRDLSRRKADWLRAGSKAMTRVMLADWKQWVDGRSTKDART